MQGHATYLALHPHEVTLISYNKDSTICKVTYSNGSVERMQPPVPLTTLRDARDGSGGLIQRVRVEVLDIQPLQGAGSKRNVRFQVGNCKAAAVLVVRGSSLFLLVWVWLLGAHIVRAVLYCWIIQRQGCNIEILVLLGVWVLQDVWPLESAL